MEPEEALPNYLDEVRWKRVQAMAGLAGTSCTAGSSGAPLARGGRKLGGAAPQREPTRAELLDAVASGG
jgi:hypothetical protein